jgi:hypothetical protein
MCVNSGKERSVHFCTCEGVQCYVPRSVNHVFSWWLPVKYMKEVQYIDYSYTYNESIVVKQLHTNLHYS